MPTTTPTLLHGELQPETMPLPKQPQPPTAPLKRVRDKGRAINNHRRWTSFLLVVKALGPSSVLFGLISTVFMLFRTLWPVSIGLADNGDGQRYVCQLGLGPAADVTRYLDFAIFNWSPDPTIADQGCIAYPSSEVWILRLAQWATYAAGGTAGDLDLRWIILANAVLVGLLVGLFAFVVRRSFFFRAASALLILAVLSDATFANYAGSVFGEYPGLVGVSIISIGAIYLGTSGFKQWLGLALVAGGSLLAVTSKTQGITLLIPIAVLLICTTMRAKTRIEERKWWTPKRLLKIIAGKILPVGIAAALVVPVLWVLDNNPKEFQAINPWELIAVGILGNSDDPASDLEEMGFPRHLSKYAGESVWVEDPITDSPDWEENKWNMTYLTAGKFLLTHPWRAIQIANNAGSDFFATRATYLGTYEQGTGAQPVQQDYSLVEDIGTQFSNMGIIPLIIVWGAIVAGAIVLLRRSDAGTIRRGFATTTLLLVGIAFIQFFTASFGEAIENTKHMVYGILAGALAPVILGVGALTTRRADGRRAHRAARYRK